MKHSDYQNKEIYTGTENYETETQFPTTIRGRQSLRLNIKLDQDFLEAIVKGKEKKKEKKQKGRKGKREGEEE